MTSKKQKNTKLLLEEHTKSYIYISRPGIGRFFAFLGTSTLAVAHFFFLIAVGKDMGVWNLDVSTEARFSQLVIIYPIIGEYLLIVFSFFCLVSFLRGGLDLEIPLFLRDIGMGLTSSLVFGSIVFLVQLSLVGLVWGLIWGLILGLIGAILFGAIQWLGVKI